MILYYGGFDSTFWWVEPKTFFSNPPTPSSPAPRQESLESPRAKPCAEAHAQATANAIHGALKMGDSSPVRLVEAGRAWVVGFESFPQKMVFGCFFSCWLVLV